MTKIDIWMLTSKLMKNQSIPKAKNSDNGKQG